MLAQHYRALIVIVAVLLLGIGALWLFSPSPQPAPPAVPPMITQAIDSALSADSEKAIAQARDYLTTDPNGYYAFFARTILAEESLNAATSTADIEASIALLKQNVALAPTPRLRATTIDHLVRAVLDKRVSYEVIFQDSSLSSYLVQGHKVQSLRNLLQYSISLSPTADAYTLLARQEADLIVAAMASTSSAANIRSPDVRASAIEEYIRQADTLAPEDIFFAQRSPYAVIVGPSLKYWRGYALAIASRVHSADAKEAEQSYLDVIAAGKKTGSQGKPVPVLEELTAYSELKVALLIYDLDGKVRAADIRAHLKNYVTAITAHPAWHGAAYDFFSSTAVGISTADVRNRKEYKGLAAISPEFAAFLKAQGWQL